jgi:hypothetical protein
VKTGEQTEQIYISSLGGELENLKGKLKSKKPERGIRSQRSKTTEQSFLFKEKKKDRKRTGLRFC